MSTVGNMGLLTTIAEQPNIKHCFQAQLSSTIYTFHLACSKFLLYNLCSSILNVTLLYIIVYGVLLLLPYLIIFYFPLRVVIRVAICLGEASLTTSSSTIMESSELESD